MIQDLSSLRFLLADDNSFSLRLVAEILKSLGARVDNLYLASNGRAALDILAHHPIDIVITDARMEPVDRLSFTKAVRASEELPNRYIPIILCTGYSERHRIIKARDAGVTEVVTKPLSVQTLYDRIREVIEKPRSFVSSTDFIRPDRRRKFEDVDEEKRGDEQILD